MDFSKMLRVLDTMIFIVSVIVVSIILSAIIVLIYRLFVANGTI